jgi:cytosine/adenosine deaminase-related metal-dependent hydrolase
MAPSFRIDNSLVLTMVEGSDPIRTSVLVEGSRITGIGDDLPDADRTIDGEGAVLLPSFVQTHIHLCQTLFRNLADDLELLDWLRLRIWPMEASLTAESMRAAADLGLAELIGGGTTTILDMGSVEHTDSIGEAVEAAGSRAFIGKAMMDRGDDVPAAMLEDTKRSLRSSLDLHDRWHGAADGRVGYAFAPRFGPSCSVELLREVSAICAERDLIIHTHCAESLSEIDIVVKEHGKSNVAHFRDCGIAGSRTVMAHMIHLDAADMDIVSATGTAVAHCPSSNLKLASGIAPIPEYLRRGITVSLGADGAPCNNRLDAFSEMRLAGLLHKPRFGATAMPARTVLEMATRFGAEALGLGDQIGTIEAGKRADLLLLRLDRPFNGVVGDPFAQIVYTASRENVVDVWCDGRQLVRDGRLTTFDESEVVATAREAASAVLRRL